MVVQFFAPEAGRCEDITKNVVTLIKKKLAFQLSLGQAVFL